MPKMKHSAGEGELKIIFFQRLRFVLKSSNMAVLLTKQGSVNVLFGEN